MSRSVITYAVLLVAALVGAYLTWTHEPETEVSEGVVVADFEPDDVEQLRYEAPDEEIVVERKSDGGDRYFWVEATRRVEPEPQRSERPTPPGGATETGNGGLDAGVAGTDAGPASAVESDGAKGTEAGAANEPSTGDEQGDDDPPTTEREVYRASDVVSRFLEDIDPLRARRRLPEPGAERRKAYGFDGETKRLIITTSAGERTFTVGAHTYGRKHVYMRDEKTGTYYVVDVAVIGPFKFADTRLRESRVLAEGEDELAEVSVQADGESIDLVRHNRDDPSAAYWSFGDDETERNKTAQSWIDKLLRLQIDRYLEGDRPSDLEPRLVVRVSPTDGETTTLEIYEQTTGDTTKYFAQSDFTKRPVELKRSSASSLVGDLSTLFDAGEAGQ